MNQDDQNKQAEQPQATRKITTTITCQKCGEKQTIEIEVPEAENTPKMAWQD